MLADILSLLIQETMVDNALRTISYIADIGSVVVLMARRRVSQSAALDCNETSLNSAEARKQYRMICYVFESEDVSQDCTLIAHWYHNIAYIRAKVQDFLCSFVLV